MLLHRPREFDHAPHELVDVGVPVRLERDEIGAQDRCEHAVWVFESMKTRLHRLLLDALWRNDDGHALLFRVA